MENKVKQFLDDKSITLEAFEDASLDVVAAINSILNDKSMSFESVERVESLLKFVLKKMLSNSLSGTDARSLCNDLKAQGLMFKFKPYAVKASNPFGYSVFLQRPKEGFSFQNHLEHKTEVFHILNVLPGGYVFLCKYDQWKEHYEPATFKRWLEGESHPFFDACRFVPEPGDTFVISELGIVHTVVGCILEEFATISTDMVQRLHDQNDRNSVPMPSESEISETLVGLELPTQNRVVDMLYGNEIAAEPIKQEQHAFGRSVLLTDTFLKASHFWVDPNKSTPVEIDPERTSVIRIFDGRCKIYLQDPDEHAADLAVEPVIAEKGELVVIPNGIHFRIENASDIELACSEHRILASVALH